MGVGAVKYSNIVIVNVFVRDEAANFAGDKGSFGTVAEAVNKIDFVAGFVFRPENFFLAVAVVLNYGVGGVKDLLSGAVILFELDSFGVGIILLEIENVLHIGAAETVN